MALAFYHVLESELAEAVDAFLEPWYFRSPVWGGIARECRRAFCHRVGWLAFQGGKIYGRTPSAKAIIESNVFWQAYSDVTRWSWLFEKGYIEPWCHIHESSSETSESSSTYWIALPGSSSETSDHEIQETDKSLSMTDEIHICQSSSETSDHESPRGHGDIEFTPMQRPFALS